MKGQGLGNDLDAGDGDLFQRTPHNSLGNPRTPCHNSRRQDRVRSGSNTQLHR
jgi:hypothetical protein